MPGTGIRIGLDPIIGLIPGLGDAAGAVLSLWILLEGSRRGAPKATLARITWNIAVDALIGAVPLIGDLFDVAWKANLRNVALLERHQADPARAAGSDRVFVALLGTAVVGLSAAAVVGGALLLRWLFHAIVGQ